MAYELFETCLLVPGIGRSECAAWVQAWGTILAVVGAIAISRLQSYEKRRADISDELDNLQILYHFFETAANLANYSLASAATERDPQRFDFDTLDRASEIERLLRAAPIMKLPAWDATRLAVSAPKALHDLRVNAAACMTAWQDLREQPEAHISVELVEEFDRARTNAVHVFSRALEVCGKRMLELGFQPPPIGVR